MRAKEAGVVLGVSAQTVRKWCNDGVLPFSWSAAGQRVFDGAELERFRRERLGLPVSVSVTVFYVRSSDNNDVSHATQVEKLKSAFGEPDLVIRDKASGLNDNRKGLNKLLDMVNNKEITRVCVTNKDRLTRFGYGYLERYFDAFGVELVVLDDSSTKEPHEVLMHDFMSLIASFSGRFYRIRGWEQQRKLLKSAEARMK